MTAQARESKPGEQKWTEEEEAWFAKYLDSAPPISEARRATIADLFLNLRVGLPPRPEAE